MASTPAPGAGGSWYAIVAKDRGGIVPEVVSAAQWEADQTPGPEGATFQNIGAADGYTTKAQAQAAVTAFNKLSNPEKLAKAGVTTAPDPSLPNPLKGLAAIGDFFQRLSQASTWVRVGEVVLGVILLGVGVARITHAQNFISTAVKAAAV